MQILQGIIPLYVHGPDAAAVPCDLIYFSGLPSLKNDAFIVTIRLLAVVYALMESRAATGVTRSIYAAYLPLRCRF